MSKILKITMILVMAFFAVFITPQERASAFVGPFAVGGALYLGGAGVYVAGVVGVAAIAGIAGCESCQEDIEAHAQRTWDGSTQIVKDGIQLMVDASIGAWGATSSALTAVDANVNTWIDSQIQGFVNQGLASKYGNLTAATSKLGCNCTNYDTKFINQPDTNFGFSANGTYYKELFIAVNATVDIKLQYSLPTGTVNVTLKSMPVTNALKDEVGAITTAAKGIAFAQAHGVSVPYGFIADMKADSALMLASAVEAWEEMTDAGLVLPVDNARPMNGDIPLTYDPVTDSYAGIDGVNVPRDNITMDYQKPHWKTLEDLAMLGLTGLGAGLYIDGWAGSDSVTSVYDPVTDTTTTTTSSTGTTTNVTTGETVTTDAGTTSTTTTGDTTTNNTPTAEGDTPKTQTGKANRWGKLVTTKFPFSLPWDLFFILSFMNADPVSPVFEVDERIMKRENVEGIQIKFAIDLSFLDPYVPWFRRFLVLGFAFFLLMNTRKLLGGAQ